MCKAGLRTGASHTACGETVRRAGEGFTGPAIPRGCPTGTSSYERPTDGPGPAPTDGAGVLSSITGPRGAGDAIASDMRQSDKQRAAKDLWRLKGDTKCGYGKHGGTPQRRSEGER
eukprot:scaffold1447_cov115-Isochrysis_galbana.AAC.8